MKGAVGRCQPAVMGRLAANGARRSSVSMGTSDRFVGNRLQQPLGAAVERDTEGGELPAGFVRHFLHNATADVELARRIIGRALQQSAIGRIEQFGKAVSQAVVVVLSGGQRFEAVGFVPATSDSVSRSTMLAGAIS